MKIPGLPLAQHSVVHLDPPPGPVVPSVKFRFCGPCGFRRIFLYSQPSYILGGAATTIFISTSTLQTLFSHCYSPVLPHLYPSHGEREKRQDEGQGKGGGCQVSDVLCLRYLPPKPTSSCTASPLCPKHPMVYPRGESLGKCMSMSLDVNGAQCNLGSQHHYLSCWLQQTAAEHLRQNEHKVRPSAHLYFGCHI